MKMFSISRSTAKADAAQERMVSRAPQPGLPLRLPIAYRFSLVIALVICAGMALLGMVIVSNQTKVVQAQTQSFGHTIVSQLAESAKEPILADDILALEILTKSTVSNGMVLGTAIFASGGAVLTRTGITPFDIDAPFAGNAHEFLRSEPHSFHWQWEASPLGNVHAISFISPVRFQNVIAGYVLITFSRSLLDQSLRDSIKAIVTVTVLFILLGLLTSYLLGRHLSRPIHHLMDASQAIQEGRYQYRIPERRNDEVGHLIEAFNNMAQGLLQKAQVEAAFSRFVSAQVAKEILSNLEQVHLGGKHVVGSVVFADLVGYTRLSEQLGSEAVAALLNEYFSYISRASSLYRGHVDKYIGDCAMLVFGVPEPDENHSLHAIACAVLFQRLVDHLNAHRLAKGQQPIQFRLGVNTGTMLAGNMGSRERMQYTVVGDTVNLASRLCSIANAGEIIITEEMYQQPGLKERIIAELHQSTINLRGKTRPVSTYIVKGVKTAYPGALEQQLEWILSGETEVPT